MRRPTVRSASAVTALALGLVGCGAGLAEAAARSVTSRTLSAGRAAVAPCGSLDSATVGWRVADGQVTGVTVTNLPTACNGAALSATLHASGTDVGHGGPVTISSGTAVIGGLSANPAPTSVSGVALSAVGP